jgi:hypothetical protein
MALEPDDRRTHMAGQTPLQEPFGKRPEQPTAGHARARRPRGCAVALAGLAAVLALEALGCLGVAWLGGDGAWVRGHGVEAYNRMIATFLVGVPLALAVILGTAAMVLLRRRE